MPSDAEPERDDSPRRPQRPAAATLLALTLVTGIVDGVTFLGLGQVFSAMQTGNVIFLGFGIAGSAGAPLVAPLLALGCFLAGGAAAVLLEAHGPSRAPGLDGALIVEVALLATAAVVAATVEVRAEEVSAYVLIGLMSLAMGLRNTIVRGIGGQNIATTVLNLTLTSVLPQGSAGLASERDLTERALGILAILAGATAGALLVKTSIVLPIAAAAALTLCVAIARRQQRPVPAASPGG